jgi:O-antigen/teichoic acid export membrane protein
MLSRTLGPEDYGLLNYGFAWYLAFMSLALFGQPSILLRVIAKYPENASEQVNASLFLLLLTTVSALSLSFALGWAFESQSQPRWLLTALLLALVARTLSEWGQAVQIGYGTAKWVFRLESVLRPLEVLLGILALALGAGLETVVWIHIGVWAIQAVGQMLAISRLHQPLRPTWNADHVLRLAREGVPMCISTLAYVWLLQGILVLGRSVLDASALLGQLALAVQVLIMLLILPRSIATAGAPVTSRALIRGDGKDVLFVNAMLRVITVLGALLALSGMAFGGI